MLPELRTAEVLVPTTGSSPDIDYPEWTDDRWRKRLLGLDQGELLARWCQLGDHLTEELNGGRWIDFLARLFYGRELADWHVPGEHWRSGLCFTVVPLLLDIDYRRLAADIGISADDYLGIMQGVDYAGPDVLDRLLAALTFHVHPQLEVDGDAPSRPIQDVLGRHMTPAGKPKLAS